MSATTSGKFESCMNPAEVGGRVAGVQLLCGGFWPAKGHPANWLETHANTDHRARMQPTTPRRLFGGAPRGRRVAPPPGSVEALKKLGPVRHPPATALLTALAVAQAEPATVEALHLAVGTSDRGALYGNLTAFAAIGLVRRSFERNGTVRFELTLGRPRRYLITCKKTGRVIELDAESTATVRGALGGGPSGHLARGRQRGRALARVPRRAAKSAGGCDKRDTVNSSSGWLAV
jgi:Fe2+ or Zn2+ uptake regulation protein